ncbi:toxin RelE [Spirochaetia bacterium]|nr:toxin RelE [Spirochaetia bacterium]
MTMWEVEYTDEFEAWWDTLSSEEQEAVDFSVGLLEDMGPSLPYPYSSSIQTSKHSKMRELRSQCGGDPLRTFYAFDPGRAAILLIGGNKTGNNRFYEEFVPLADRIYDQYLKEIRG